MAPKRQLIDVEEAKGYVETFIADPILKMAANAVLKNTKRVDAVEVVHGRWIPIRAPYKRRFQCDQCKHYVDAGTDRNYCPNCGAKMDGDGNG